MHQLRALRQLPRRLHGGEVLHWLADRRPGSQCVSRATERRRWPPTARSPGPAATTRATSRYPAEAADQTPAALQRKPGVTLMADFGSRPSRRQRKAKRRLPKPVYSALLAASERGVTVADNVDAFSSWASRHTSSARRETRPATTVMGQDISLPVLISPTGFQPFTRTARPPSRGRPPPGARRWGVDRLPASRSRGHRGQPQALLPAVLARRPGGHRGARPARPGGRCCRLDPDDRLEFLARARLG